MGTRTLAIDESVQRILRDTGLSFSVRFIGYIPIKISSAEMPAEMRNNVLNYSVTTLTAMVRSEIPAPPGGLIALVVGDPTLVDVSIQLNVSSQWVTASHDDDRNPMKKGRVIQRHPMKYTAIVSTETSQEDCFAYIAKKEDGTNRRCCVFKMDSNREAMTRLMTTLTHCMEISNYDTQLEIRDRRLDEPDMDRAEPAREIVSTESGAMSSAGSEWSLLGNNEAAENPMPPPRISPRPPAPNPPPRHGAFSSELTQFLWYHGVLTRQEAEDRIRQPGDFLVRENRESQLILTGICDNNERKHIILLRANEPNQGIITEDRTFQTVNEMVTFYTNSQQDVRLVDVPPLKMLNPISRLQYNRV